ncbi:hypothetical protein HZA96_06095 [Candidatus Woesearchaeota archaeon]|nr:hypothetical protein [Candidatus Woesearchaeota archaeon]
MTDYWTLLLFFAYSFGFGYTILDLLKLKEDEHFLTKNIVRIGIGLSIIPILGVFLNLLYIPLSWIVFLLLSIAYPVIKLFLYLQKHDYNPPKPEIHFNFLKISKKTLFILAIVLLTLVQFYIMHKGAFGYSWLEDGDPWHHAVTTKYFTEQLSTSRPAEIGQFVNYVEPYPPGYDLLMSILYQTSHQMMWTLKYFNVLLLALAVLFFGIMAHEFTKSYAKSLFAAFLLVAIPSFLGHFIWSETLAIAAFFPAFYCIIKLADADEQNSFTNKYHHYLNKVWITNKWMIPAILITASIMVTQPIAAYAFGVFIMIYWFVESLYSKKFVKTIFMIAVLGLLLSVVLYWAPVKVKFDIFGSSEKTQITSKFTELKWKIPGSADKIYTFNDFFITQPYNMINQPIGVGIFISILFFIFIASLLFTFKTSFAKENKWLLIVLLWFLFGLIAVNGRRLPAYILPFRMWPFMVIGLVFLATEGLWFLLNIFQRYQLVRVIIFTMFLVGIILTSGYHKYTVNTAIWPFNNFFMSFDEANAYTWLYTLPADTTVFEFCSPNADTRVIAYDKLAFSWDKDVLEFRKKERIMNHTNSELYSFLKQKKFDYFIIDGYCIFHQGINETNNKLQEIGNDQAKFQLVYKSDKVGVPFVFKVI